MASLETLVVRTVHKVVNTLAFVSRILDAIFDKPGFIALMAALVKS